MTEQLPTPPGAEPVPPSIPTKKVEESAKTVESDPEKLREELLKSYKDGWKDGYEVGINHEKRKSGKSWF